MSKLQSFRDLRVYQELKRLHLMVHERSLAFPKFELYELGSQIRRSSNSAPAQLAEGWGSRHTNIYIESINRAMGEARETQHHLDVAHKKRYVCDEDFGSLDAAYDSCGRMLESLHQSLSGWRDTTRTGMEVHESRTPYPTAPVDTWPEIVQIAFDTDNALPSPAPDTQHPTP